MIPVAMRILSVALVLTSAEGLRINRDNIDSSTSTKLKTEQKATSNLPIVRGKFLHLVQGPDAPDQWLCDVGMRSDAQVLYLSWNNSVTNLCDGIMDTIFAPGSTWTTGRNQLYEQAVKLQQKQGWQYEYLIFTDDDIQLFSRNETLNPYDVVHAALSNVQPAVASVPGKIMSRNKCGPDGNAINNIEAPHYVAPCSADIDAAFAAFHATAAPMLLPYDTSFDSETWYGSQAIMILLMGASMPDHVIQFNHLYYKNTQHRKYPKNIPIDQWISYVRKKANWCLKDVFDSNETTPVKPGVFFAGALCHKCRKPSLKQAKVWLDTAACEESPQCFPTSRQVAPSLIESQSDVMQLWNHTDPIDYADVLQCKPIWPNYA